LVTPKRGRISTRPHGVISQDSILQIHCREKPKFIFTAELSTMKEEIKESIALGTEAY